MKPARRKLLQIMVSAAVLPAAQRIARAQAYPTRPITIIVPFAPGGGTDVSARVVGEHMSRTLGQQFVGENFPGAGGTTGTIRAMRASLPPTRLQAGCRFRTDRFSYGDPACDRSEEGLSAKKPRGIYRIRESKF